MFNLDRVMKATSSYPIHIDLSGLRKPEAELARNRSISGVF
jgi:hypothetical protein